ncbi:MAG: hypothetical protein ACK5KP_02090 [Paludibacteraceae bacterium]
MKNIRIIIFTIFIFQLCFPILAQQNWVQISDTEAGITFAIPGNLQQYDTLSTRFYASQISDNEAVQVHIFENATPDFSDEILATALAQENGDSLLTIARLMALVSNCEITSLTEIYDNGNRGIELEINYMTQGHEMPYTTVVRYFLINNHFISFAWTGETVNNPSYVPGTIPHPSYPTRNAFFQSITTQ